MSLEQQIDADLKTAMLAGQTQQVGTLRLIKSVILNVKVNDGTRDSEMSDNKVLQLLGKESKKRQESADLYTGAGDDARAETELQEKAIIDKYLPAQLSEAEIEAIVRDVINAAGATDKSAMGAVIGQVKAKAGASADGAIIARIVKEKLQ